MQMSGITSAWLLYEMATANESPKPGAGHPAIWPSRLRADWPGRPAGDARFGKVARTILEAIAPPAGAEHVRDRHHRHRDPIGEPLRLQPVAGIFPDHELDQLESPGLVDRFRQQLLVPDVVVARLLLVHRTPRTRAQPRREVSIKGCESATDLRELYPFPHQSRSRTNPCNVNPFTEDRGGSTPFSGHPK